MTYASENDPVGGVVLAGGSGTRLGRSKATVVVRGRTLVERAVDIMAGRCQTVIVVSRPGIPLPALDVPVVLDGEGIRGPMNGLVTGLCHTEADDVIVLACDLPFAGPVIDRLAAAPPGRAVAAHDGRSQPLCARYPRAATLDACRRLMAKGVRRMTALLAELDAASIEVKDDELFNVNSAADLELARLRPPARGRPGAGP